MPQIVGPTKATKMLMLGTQVKAKEAVLIGLTNEIVSVNELQTAVMSLARRLNKGPARAQVVLKEGLRRGMASTLAAEWEHNIYAQSMLISAVGFTETIQAFKAKRAPKFR